MPALTANVEFEFDANHPPSLTQVKGEADTYFRGGLAHHTAGILNLAPLANEDFAGVIWGQPDPNPITLNDLVWIAITGRFFFAAAGFTDANYGLVMGMPAADLTDDPGALLPAETLAATGAGTLDHVASTGVNGWIDISRRASPLDVA